LGSQGVDLLLLQANPIAEAMYGKEWVFPTLEMFHIVGVGVAIETIALIDLSLLGLEV
jgi:hypothetical protein